MAEAKSIETTLIKLSLRSLWYIIVATFLGGGYCYTLYTNLESQNQQLKDVNVQIMNKIDKLDQSVSYRFESNEKDIVQIDKRVTKLEGE